MPSPGSLMMTSTFKKRSKWTLIASLVRNEVGEMTNDLISQAQVNKLSPEEEKKLKLEQEKREKTLQAYRKERHAKHEKTEEEREKFRDAIRQKYGIQRSATTGDAEKKSSPTQKLKSETSDARKEYRTAGAEERRKRGMRKKQDSLQEGMKKLFIH